MRTTKVLAAMTAVLALSACGGARSGPADVEPAEQSSTEGEKPGPGNAPGSGDIADLSTALVTVDDLPAGTQIMPVDVADLDDVALAAVMDDVVYEPADCGQQSALSSVLLGGDDVDTAAVAMTLGEGLDADFAAHAVFADADPDDLAQVEDYAKRCAEVTITASDMEMTSETAVVDSPSIDADQVLSLTTTTTVGGMDAGVPTLHAVYAVEGGYGFVISAYEGSANFDLDALSQAAMERLQAARA